MTLTRRTRLPPRRLDVRCVLWRVPRAACRAHDRRERLSRCVLVVSGFAWIKGVVLDESLQPEMCNYYAWRKCAFKRQKSTPRIGAAPIKAAIKAYNAKADLYHQVVQKKGQPLREGFSIAMVRAARLLSLLGVASREVQSRDLATSRDRGRSCLTLPWRNLSGDAIS